MTNTFTEILKGRIPAFAASDIVAGTVVTEVTGSAAVDRSVVMATSASVEPLGVVRNDQAYAYASNPGGVNAVAIYDKSNEKLVVAGASITAGQNVGVTGLASEVHPISGAIVAYPTYGPVSASSGSAQWRVGVARSTAAPGAQFLLRIDPHQLSGLS